MNLTFIGVTADFKYTATEISFLAQDSLTFIYANSKFNESFILIVVASSDQYLAVSTFLQIIYLKCPFKGARFSYISNINIREYGDSRYNILMTNLLRNAFESKLIIAGLDIAFFHNFGNNISVVTTNLGRVIIIIRVIIVITITRSVIIVSIVAVIVVVGSISWYVIVLFSKI